MFQSIPELRGVRPRRSMREPELHLHPASRWKDFTYQPCSPIGLTPGEIKAPPSWLPRI